LTYYWNYPDSNESFRYLINIKNDSFKLIYPKDLTFIRVFEDKEDSSIRVYKYETMKDIGPVNLSLMLSKEYGQVGVASHPHQDALLVTHWNGKPLDKRYQELLRSNLKQIFTPEWESPYRRRSRIRRSRHPAQ
jgi:hypothetical protein